MEIPKSLQTQVGGNHYQKYKVQPLEFAEKKGLSPIVFCIYKYVCRYKDKNGLEDLKKALHCCDVFAECGVEKEILYSTNELGDFLSQFENQHAKAMFDVLKVQGSKEHIGTLKSQINTLMQEFMYEQNSKN